MHPTMTKPPPGGRGPRCDDPASKPDHAENTKPRPLSQPNTLLDPTAYVEVIQREVAEASFYLEKIYEFVGRDDDLAERFFQQLRFHARSAGQYLEKRAAYLRLGRQRNAKWWNENGAPYGIFPATPEADLGGK
jgi:hypothetical protein